MGGCVRAIRLLLCGLGIACSLGMAPHAFATSFTTDQSDLWYIPAESGWGMQLVQRGGVIFATLYVYDFTSKPTWFVATMDYQGSLVWSGDLYATTGPWFGTTPFDPTAVTIRKVGTMTWTSKTVNTGALSYDVDGVNVSKDVVREAIALDDFSGHYAGATHRALTGCTNPSLNAVTETLGVMFVNQTGNALEVTNYALDGGSCTYAGTLTQAGQMGSAMGSYSCTSGESGTFVWSEMQVNPLGLSSRFTIESPMFPGCQGAGWMGGTYTTIY
jgi:hypothetical protein